MNESLQAAAALGGSIAVFIAAVWTGVQSRQAKHQATQAAENSHPISNGWGTALRADMAATRQTVERISEAQLLAERRELHRDEHLDRIEQRLQDHIDQHEKGVTV